MPLLDEDQQDDGNSLAGFSFDVTGGSAKSSYYLTSTDAQNLQGTINNILGYTDTTASNGRRGLNRVLPQRHPKFPYLYASRISSLTGVGFNSPGTTMQDAVNPSLAALNAPPISRFLQYNKYRIGIEFTGPRTYAMLGNEFITQQSSTWTRPNGSPQVYSWSPEFLRYTDVDFIPQDNTIQGSQGEMSIYKNGSLVPFTSPPWMWLPDWILKITWYQVPFRFILSSNSYIAASPWRGRVNQNYMWFWPPGWLLYLGYNVKKYAPPTGFTQTISSTTSGAFTYANYAQLCDIELNFLITNRQLRNSPGFATGNNNYVLGLKADGVSQGAGHNLLPDVVSGQFYYATRNDSSGNAAVTNPPAWLSAPLEVLFSDPDSGGGPELV